MTLEQIISGGQTGVDRGALDAALQEGFPCGGWCPDGREVENGRIPDRYPLKELEGAGYRQRTIQNITDSDGTVIIHYTVPEGGTAETLAQCLKRKKPFHLIDATEIKPKRAAMRLAFFLQEHDVARLNVAGPRQSTAPAAREYTQRVINHLIRLFGQFSRTP